MKIFFKEFLAQLSNSEVDEWWDSLVDIPEDALKNHWKYKMVKGGKKAPFKWGIVQLARLKNYDISGFTSSDWTRDQFCEKFNFDIEEDLVSDKTEDKLFLNFYDRCENKQPLRSFIEYANRVLCSVKVEPYKVRTTVSKQELSVVIGKVTILSFNEQDNTFGLAITKQFYDNSRDFFKDYNTKIYENSLLGLITAKVPLHSWTDLPSDLLSDNLEACKIAYDLVQLKKVVKWSLVANTINSTLKSVIFKNNISEVVLFEHQSLQSKYEEFLKLKSSGYSEWYDNLKFYSDLMQKLRSNLRDGKYNSYDQLNQDFNSYLNQNDDFLDRYLFMSDNGLSSISQQLISRKRRYQLRISVEENFYLLKNIILSDSPEWAFKALEGFISENKWSVIFRFIRALFPSQFTSVDAPNWFGKLLKLMNNDFNFQLHNKSNDNYVNQIRNNEIIIKSLVFDDIYCTQIFFWDLVQSRHGALENLVHENIFDGNTTLNPMIEFPLNQILYGAPGTGKTYLTKKLAIDIIDGKNYNEEDRDSINERYSELVKNKQIVFTTFHQSLSYEDFMEGIKPDTIETTNQIIYEVRDGIFKSIAKDALRENQQKTRKLYNDFTYPDYDEAWANLVDEARKKIDEGEGLLELETLSKRRNKIVEISSQGNLIIKPELGEKQSYGVSYGRAKKLFNAFPDLQQIKNIDKEFRQVIGGSNSTTYWSVIKYLQKWIHENGKITVNEIPQPIKKFVIVIDEINRGNVSSIFGELITLIEDDKRFGVLKKRTDTSQVILPYSKDEFTVPDNLYIIGTMNTADRSVEALDTALRRRFSFKELRPDSSKLSEEVYINSKIDLRKLLETINERVELLIDKDHQIGHSYFICLNTFDDLKSCFTDKVLPLLEEYFFGDYGKIGLVLGGRFVMEKTVVNVLPNDFFYERVDQFTDKKLYELVPSKKWTEDTFISVYEAI